MSDDLVTVVGPNGRHIEIHKDIQAGLPDIFPLAEKKAAQKSPAPKRRTAKKVTPVEAAVPVTETNDTKELDNDH
jgi:hypothetical protein